MTTMIQIDPAVKPTLPMVEIKGATYSVETISPGECGVSAARVTKLVNGESYDVIRTRLNVVECTCPDYVCRHEGKGTLCKHAASMVARGFLPTPDAPPTMPGYRPAPVTSADRKRASYFGLRIPAPAPVVVEAPAVAPIEAPAPAPVEADDPGDSWETWQDDATWELGPDAQPIEPVTFLHPENFADAPAGQEWVAITPRAGVLRDVEPTGPRPTRIDRFTPTPEMEMEHLGHELGFAGEDARAPEGRTFPELVAFYGGWLAGRADQQVEFNAWLDSVEADRERMDDAFGGPEATWHPAELAEAQSFAGHPAFEG
jgi:hypothetical protein